MWFLGRFKQVVDWLQLYLDLQKTHQRLRTDYDQLLRQNTAVRKVFWKVWEENKRLRQAAVPTDNQSPLYLDGFGQQLMQTLASSGWYGNGRNAEIFLTILYGSHQDHWPANLCIVSIGEGDVAVWLGRQLQPPPDLRRLIEEYEEQATQSQNGVLTHA